MFLVVAVDELLRELVSVVLGIASIPRKNGRILDATL
jgi:hypothetical protein